MDALEDARVKAADHLAAGTAPAMAGDDEVGTDGPGLTRLANLRDLGGHPVDGGGTTRHGVLYRSEAPKWRDEAPAAHVVATWPPRTVLDLRSAVERGRRPHPLSADGTTVHTVPLLGEDVEDPSSRSVAVEAMRGGLETLYAMLLEFAAPRLVEIAHIVAEAPGPILVHCAAGKDRTGMVSALLLRAVGVPAATVVADYAATKENMPVVMRRLGGRTLLPGTEHLKAEDLVGTSVPAVEQVLRVLDSNPGGPVGWLRDAGADQAALSAWHERFVIQV